MVRRRLRRRPLRQPEARRSSRCSRAAGASRPTASSRCGRTTCSSRSSRHGRERGAHEKGGVEGEVGRFRRRHLVPVPGGRLARRAQRAAARGLRARSRAHGSPGARTRSARRWARERPLLRALPARAASRRPRHATPRVDSQGAGHGPPEPLLGPGRAGRAAGRAPGSARARSRSAHGGREVARHERLVGPLRRPAPSSITTSSCSRASPARWRARSRSPRNATAAPGPTASTSSGRGSTERYGRSEAARQMVDVVLLCREHGPAAGRARGPRRAGRRRARRPRRRGPRPPSGAPADAGAARPTSSRGWPRTSGPHRSRRLRPAARRRTMTAPPTRRPRRLEALIEAHADRAQAPDRPPPLPRARRGSHPRAADPGRLPRRAAGGRDGRTRRTPRTAAPASTRASRAIKRLEDFRFADNPKRPAGHDRRARRGLLDR